MKPIKVEKIVGACLEFSEDKKSLKLVPAYQIGDKIDGMVITNYRIKGFEGTPQSICKDVGILVEFNGEQDESN